MVVHPFADVTSEARWLVLETTGGELELYVTREGSRRHFEDPEGLVRAIRERSPLREDAAASYEERQGWDAFAVAALAFFVLVGLVWAIRGGASPGELAVVFLGAVVALAVGPLPGPLGELLERLAGDGDTP